MSYTYTSGKNTTEEDFKGLCKRIEELYPDYKKPAAGNTATAERMSAGKRRGLL